jgi:hypothetical protein
MSAGMAAARVRAAATHDAGHHPLQASRSFVDRFGVAMTAIGR